MAKGRHKKQTRGAAMYKKSRILKRTKMKSFKSIARKGQPSPTLRAPALEKKISPGGAVASSWISGLQWDNKRNVALMHLLNGYFYEFKIPFSLFEKWYYATSKGTFFNSMVKDKFPYKRLM